MVSRTSLPGGTSATARSAACGASIGMGRRPVGTGSALASAISSAGTLPERGKTVEHAVTRLSRARCGRAVRPPRLRRLRQRHQERRFAEREPPRLLAEIGQRGGADAFDIAAIRREIEIERRAPASLVSARSISIARTIWRSLAEKLRPLRGSSSRATCMVSVEPPERIRPLVTSWNVARSERQRIDAAMRAEALVLVGEQQVEEPRIDVGDCAPASASALRWSHKPAAAGPRDRPRASKTSDPAERRRAERSDPPRGSRQHRDAGHRCGDDNEARSRVRHFPAVTSTLSVAVRPKRSGRYMSSTLACGRTYLPGATARTT